MLQDIESKKLNYLETARAKQQQASLKYSRCKSEYDQHLQTFMTLQDSYTNLRLIAAGIPPNGVAHLNSLLCQGFPYFQKLSNAVADSATYLDTIKKGFIAGSDLPLTQALQVGETLCTYALMGDFLSSDSFYITHDPKFFNFFIKEEQRVVEMRQTRGSQLAGPNPKLLDAQTATAIVDLQQHRVATAMTEDMPPLAPNALI